MELFWALILSLVFCVLGMQGRGFIKTNTILFDEIENTNHAKTLIECCGFCGLTPSCQGVKFNGVTCTAINNVVPNFRAKFDQIAWIDAELYKHTKKLIFFSGSTDKTEIIDLSFASSHILPKTYLGGLGGQISETQAILCPGKESKECRYFDIAKHQEFTLLPNIIGTPRYNSRAIGIPKLEGIWIIGGQHTDTSEIITKTSSQPGPPVPVMGLQSSCITEINSTTLMVIGGSAAPNNQKTWFVDIESDIPTNWRWIEGPELKAGRVGHACITWHVEDQVFALVFGGHGLASTEFLNLDTNQWFYGVEDLAFDILAPTLAEISDQDTGKKVIYLFGGYNEDANQAMDLIYKLKCGNQLQINTCHWFLTAQKLRVPRSFGIIIQI